MAEVTLEIRPKLVGDVRGQVRKITSAVSRAGKTQERSLNRADKSAARAERTFNRLAKGVGRVGQQSGQSARSMLSLTGALSTAANVVQSGLASLISGGGRTFVDLLIGSNEKLESQKLTFRTLVGDAGKANDLIDKLRKNAATTPFAEEDVLEAGKRLLRSTGANVDMNVRLVEQAQTLAALNSDKTVVDAAEAILDAQLGEFERLKEFSIKLSKKDVEKSKKSGTTLATAAVEAIQGRIKKMGADDLVAELATSFTGRKSTFIDSFKRVLQEAGKEGFKAASEGLTDLQKDLDKLTADPQFREDMRDVGRIIADASRFSVDLVRNLPTAIRDLRAFIEENKTALVLGAGVLGANKLSGGGLARGAVGGAGRLLFGKGASGGVGAAAAGMLGEGGPDGTRVFVTNFPAAIGGTGGGQGGLAQRAAAGRAGLTGKELGSLKFGGGGGAVGAIGIGGVAAGALGIGAFALAVKTFAETSAKTQGIIARFDAKAEAARFPTGSVKARADAAVAASNATRARQKDARDTGGIRGILDEARTASGDERRQLLQGAAATAQASVAGTKGGARKERLAQLTSQVAGFGLEAEFSGGRVKFREARSISKRLEELVQFDRNLRSNPEAESALRATPEGKKKLAELEAEGAALVERRARAEGLIGGGINARVEKGAIQITINAAPGETATAVGAEVTKALPALEAQLQRLTSREGQNR